MPAVQVMPHPLSLPCRRFVTSRASQVTGIAQFFFFLHCQESHPDSRTEEYSYYNTVAVTNPCVYDKKRNGSKLYALLSPIYMVDSTRFFHSTKDLQRPTNPRICGQRISLDHPIRTYSVIPHLSRTPRQAAPEYPRKEQDLTDFSNLVCN